MRKSVATYLLLFAYVLFHFYLFALFITFVYLLAHFSVFFQKRTLGAYEACDTIAALKGSKEAVVSG